MISGEKDKLHLDNKICLSTRILLMSL